MRIGITGHQHLDDASEWSRISAELRNIISAEATPLIGLTSLAIGADQLFAEVVLERGGSIEAIIPFDGYESKFEDGPSRQKYQRLLASATKVTTLQPQQTEEHAYLEAGKLIVATSDKLIAIWDGKRADGLGGTGDIVAYANHIQKPVVLIHVRN